MPDLTSIRLHRLLLVASILVPAALFVGAAAWNRFEVVRTEERNVRRTVRILNEHALKVFDTVDLVMDHVQDRTSNMNPDEIAAPQMSAFLGKMKEPLPQAVSIWVTDREGRILAGSQAWNPDVRINEREWFTAQEERDVGNYVSATFEGKATKAISFAVSRRRTTPDGHFDGIIHVALNPVYFERFFADVSPRIGNVAALFRSDGAILARIPERRPDARIPAQSELLRHINDQPHGGALYTVSSVDGRDLFLAYQPIGGLPLFVAYGIERGAMLSAWYVNLAIYGFVAGLAALTLFLVSWLALKRTRAAHSALVELRSESEQRLNAEQQLRQSQKMDSIGQLTGGIAHDFNNLLAVIMGNLELLRKRVKEDERSMRLVDGAVQGTQRGATLTQRLLAFARRQELAPRSVSVPDLVDGMTDLLTRTLGPSVRIVSHFPERLPTVMVDPNQLEVALLNLAVNARDAMPEGGTIKISARAETMEEGALPLLNAGDYVCISVADNGIGMDEGTLAMSIEPFFTTKGAGKGTGLGLSTVHGLAIQSGGTLHLESKRGLGTTVEIWLPQGGSAAAPVHNEPDRREGDPLTILMVDDDTLVLEGTTAMLEDLGHKVQAFPSGEEALDFLSRGMRVDLMITDYAMPGMSGLQLAEKVRAIRPAMPIILASGHSEFPDRPNLHLPRLRKPFRQSELAMAIVTIVGFQPSGGNDVVQLRRRQIRPVKD